MSESANFIKFIDSTEKFSATTRDAINLLFDSLIQANKDILELKKKIDALEYSLLINKPGANKGKKTATA